MVNKKDKTKVSQKPQEIKKKKTINDQSESDLSLESKDLSALGGGNMPNPSSSDPSSSQSEGEDEILSPGMDKGTNLNPEKQAKDSRRSSSQFIEKLNLTEMGSIIDEDTIVPLFFGSEEKIAKN